ncbi:MAG: transcriptional repressor [Lachnospiraceae bacterium]|nr:transcriptional repressor [Lachnospiraceae bacterium]
MAKYSKQREIIKKNVLSRYDHPTADAVYNSIREDIPNISLGTVYRNLRLLVEQNEILSLDLGDGKEHFDGHTELHYHFICSQCNSIHDLYMPELEINKVASKYFSGKITGHCTYFYGLCKDCSAAINNY